LQIAECKLQIEKLLTRLLAHLKPARPATKQKGHHPLLDDGPGLSSELGAYIILWPATSQ
jgi:hypothetical protein